MNDKFQNKYRIASARLQHWDYASAGAYFITICTKDRRNYFGEIENGKMILNEIGKTTENEWLKTPDIRPDMNIELGEFVVMPNHFHAILIIGENEYNGDGGRGCGGHGGVGRGDGVYGDVGRGDGVYGDVGRGCGGHGGVGYGDGGGRGRDAMHCVSTLGTSGTPQTPTTGNQFGPQQKNVASIIRGFKSSVTKYARMIQTDFAWQPRFHDHIIRDEKSFHTISQYIINNPANWDKDKFYGKL